MLRLAIKVGIGLVLVLVLYVGVTFLQVWQASRGDDPEPAQAIVVLGAAQYDGRPSPVLAARLDHAVELHEQGLAPLLVLTGGRRPGDRATEASASAGYVIAKGVPEEALLLESSGDSSWQSLAAAARILGQRGLTDVILVSDPYHSLRISAIADEVGLDAQVSPSDTANTFASLAKETAAVSVGRIIGYGRLVRLDERVRDDGGTG